MALVNTPDVTGIRVLTLAGPAVSSLFGAAFLCVWLRWKRFRYLPWLSLGFSVFTAASLSQILMLPRDIGMNALVSACLYLLAVLFVIKGCLMRVGLRSHYLLDLAAFVLILIGLAHYFYVDRNLQARIYILNLGIGILFLITAIRVGSVAQKTVDRSLFGVLLLFAFHFVPRTFLSMRHIGSVSDPNAFAQTSFWAWLNLSFVIFGVLLGVTLLATAASDVVTTLSKHAWTDPLTGLLNRRGFEESAGQQMAKVPLGAFAIVVCDVDGFKLINDAHGHAGGDRVLVRIAGVLSENIRNSDVLGRLGGEEFVLLLSGLNLPDAYALVERLREAIKATRFGLGELSKRRITASFGIVEHREGEPLESAIHRADEMLYAAKRSGRNKTVADGLRSGLSLAVGADGARVD
jgi:diguanylate cyclase (GGDEF)-like protein